MHQRSVEGAMGFEAQVVSGEWRESQTVWMRRYSGRHMALWTC